MNTTNPYESPETSGARRDEPKKKRWFTKLFVVIGIIGVLWLLLLPTQQTVRESARRNQCGNQLREIGFALRAYQEEYGCLPPAYVVDQTGQPIHSWRTLILPYLDEQQLYDQYNFDEPWDHPENVQVTRDSWVYSCPSWEDSERGKTTYMLITGPGTLFEGDRTVCLNDEALPDGGKTTIILAETTSPGVTWTEPADLDVSKMTFQINGGPGEIGSDHSGSVAMVLFADGHIDALSTGITPEQLREMCTTQPVESE